MLVVIDIIFGAVGVLVLVVIDIILVALVLSLAVLLAFMVMLPDVLTALNCLGLFGIGSLCGTSEALTSDLAVFDFLFV